MTDHDDHTPNPMPYPGSMTTLHDVESIRALPAHMLSPKEGGRITHHRTIEIVQNLGGKKVRSTFVCFAEERDNLKVKSDA